MTLRSPPMSSLPALRLASWMSDSPFTCEFTFVAVSAGNLKAKRSSLWQHLDSYRDPLLPYLVL